MDALSIPGPPCPICGQNAFSGQPTDDLTVEIGDRRFHPRVCAECGNVQLVLIRCDELEEVVLAE